MRRNWVFNGPVLTAFVMLTIFVTMSLIALGLLAQSRLMPLMIGVSGSILALIQVFQELRAARAGSSELDGKETGKRGSELKMFMWMFFFVVGILAFGFVYAAPTLVFSFLTIGKNESTKIALFAAAGTWAVLGLFERGFEIQLFTGLVVEWLLG